MAEDIHQWTGLEGAVELTRLERGTRLYVPGEPADRLFLLRSGRVKIGVRGPGGKNCLFRLAGGGEVFGEDALLAGAVRHAEAEVIDTASVLMAPRDAVIRHAERDSGFWRELALCSVSRVCELENRIESLSLYEVEQRIAHLLLHWAQPAGREQQAGDLFEIHLSQQDLAGMVGSTRETTSVALNRLRRDGCVELRRRCLIVRSLECLARHARPLSPMGPSRADEPTPQGHAGGRSSKRAAGS